MSTVQNADLIADLQWQHLVLSREASETFSEAHKDELRQFLALITTQLDELERQRTKASLQRAYRLACDYR